MYFYFHKFFFGLFQILISLLYSSSVLLTFFFCCFLTRFWIQKGSLIRNAVPEGSLGALKRPQSNHVWYIHHITKALFFPGMSSNLKQILQIPLSHTSSIGEKVCHSCPQQDKISFRGKEYWHQRKSH